MMIFLRELVPGESGDHYDEGLEIAKNNRTNVKFLGELLNSTERELAVLDKGSDAWNKKNEYLKGLNAGIEENAESYAPHQDGYRGRVQSWKDDFRQNS